MRNLLPTSLLGLLLAVFAFHAGIPPIPLSVESVESPSVRNRGAAARIGPEALLELIESGATGYIELDSIYRPSLRDSLPIIGADLVHRLDFDGDGRFLAVLDTGFETNHPMFADRIVEEACFSLLGHDPILELTGVAPHSRLIAIRIFSVIDNEIGAFSSDILAGLQHVLALAPFYAIDAVNLSFGGNEYPSEAECDTAVRSQRIAVGMLRSLGITTVAASGNEHLTNAITTPACLSNVFGVGSTNDEDDVSSFSNSASFLSILAPGQSIESAGLGGTTRFASGTSMASPHVAGAIAAIREAHPNASAAEIENALVLSGVPILDERNGETHSRIDVYAAIRLIAAGAPTLPPEEEANPELEHGSNNISAATPSGSGGGGGGCGLVGIEPFLVLGGVRLGRRIRRTRESRVSAVERDSPESPE